MTDGPTALELGGILQARTPATLRREKRRRPAPPTARLGRRLRILVGWLCLLGAGAPAQAHTTWSNGDPVPDWVSRACCGPGDAHHLRPAQVHRVTDGYRIDGYPGIIYDAQVLPSQDGEFWAFYAVGADPGGAPVFSSVFCFFVPSWG